MTVSSEHQEEIKFGQLLLQSMQGEEESSESNSDSDEVKSGRSEDEASSQNSDSERSERIRKHRLLPSTQRQGQRTERSLVKDRFDWNVAQPLPPLAKTFIEEVNLTGPLKRWREDVLVKLSDFIKRMDPRIQELDLKKEIARQVNASFSQQQAQEEQQQRTQSAQQTVQQEAQHVAESAQQ